MTPPRLKFKNSHIPLVGFGTYLIKNEEIEPIITQALNVGYRHIDTAQAYGNEEGIGKAIGKSSLSRKDLYLTSKLWPGHAQWGQEIKNHQSTIEAVEESLKNLKTDYLDLYLIHAPFAKELRIEQWMALNHLRDQGKIKDIGVSNYNIQHLEEIRRSGLPLPSVNQIELHPWSQKPELVAYMKEHGIQAIAYSSLIPLSTWRERPGEDSAKSDEMKKEGQKEDSVFKQLAKKYGVSESQILLKWAVQQKIPVVPKSTKPERMKQNIDLFNFEMTSDDLKLLNSLDRGESVAWAVGDPTKFEA